MRRDLLFRDIQNLFRARDISPGALKGGLLLRQQRGYFGPVEFGELFSSVDRLADNGRQTLNCSGQRGTDWENRHGLNLSIRLKVVGEGFQLHPYPVGISRTGGRWVKKEDRTERTTKCSPGSVIPSLPFQPPNIACVPSSLNGV